MHEFLAKTHSKGTPLNFAAPTKWINNMFEQHFKKIVNLVCSMHKERLLKGPP